MEVEYVGEKNLGVEKEAGRDEKSSLVSSARPEDEKIIHSM